MAKQLTMTTLIKKAIKIAGVRFLHLEYFIDKNPSSRRYKFWGAHPTAEQVGYLNRLFKIIDVNITATLYNKPNSRYSNNCLVFVAK